MDTSYDDFSKAIPEPATILPEKKSTKFFKRELYLLHKQLKARYRQRHEADSNYFEMKRGLKKFCKKHKMMHEIDRERFLIRRQIRKKK